MTPKNLCPLVSLLTLLLATPLVLPLALGAETPGADAPKALAGRVVDAAGRPIAGAEIWELPFPANSVDQVYETTVDPPARRLAVSGADGRFAARAVDRDSKVEVCHDGYLLELLARASGARPAAVVLQPVSRISGQVLAPDGSPVSGAKVSAQDPRWVPSDLFFDEIPASPPCPRSEPSLKTLTDAQGRFTLEPLRPGRYAVWATATGYRKSASGHHLTLGLGQGLPGVEIRLAPGAVVQGRVTTPTGEAVAGAEVISPEDDARTRTDGSGAYRLAGVSPSGRNLGAEVHGDSLVARAQWQSFEVAPGENRLDFTVPPQGREVRGRVLAPDGTPVAGALLHSDSACPDPSEPRLHTAADGSFVLHLPAGIGRLVATRTGYSPGEVALPPGAKAVAGATIHLAPDRGLTVRLVGGEPAEVQGALIDLDRREGDKFCRFFGQAEADGSYRFADLWPGELEVAAYVDGRVLKRRVKLTAGAEAHLDLPLLPKLAVHGRVAADGARGSRAGWRESHTRSPTTRAP